MALSAAVAAQVAAGALWSGEAVAQEATLLPGVSVEQREQFRLCRAAVFYHLDPASSPGRVIPRAVAETLNDQIAFIMAETLRSSPAGSLAEDRRMIDFTESFFLAFSRTIAENRALAQDAAARETLLMGCIPLVWTIVGDRLDRLLTYREANRRIPSAPLPGVGR
jgi:hypothetical protein